MSGHRDHDLAGEALIDAARSVLIAADEQWTAMRADVFEALAARATPGSAYDIAEIVGARRGKRVAANTVYRILDVFERANLARRIESANAYVANPHPGCRHDCIFMICDACGRASHLDNDALTGALRDAARLAGFADVRPVVEVRGLCGACAAD